MTTVIPAARMDGASATSADGPGRLRVLTLNTWFKPDHRAQRLAAQLAMIAELDADVVALQEVTPDLLALLQASPWVRQNCALPERPERLLAEVGYGVLLLVKPAVQHFTWQPFESTMGRGLLTAVLPGGLHVGTVHLESMRTNTGPRAEQLAAATRWLTGAPAALLVGDFNFDDDDPGAPGLGPWTDLWTVGQPHAPGWTADEVVNTMRSRPRPPERRRIDRVLLHQSDPRGAWVLEDIRLVGTEALAPSVWMSDHYGILVDLHRRT